ncbi:hypothetical protein DRO55_04675 [Candidatus Bathyarchaeota archaeon]|nr:MAG: hypothetical protein DRO55_04675 [Candidatus Bathyarchaeota archaeon]
MKRSYITLLLAMLLLLMAQSIATPLTASNNEETGTSEGGIPALYSSLSSWNASVDGALTWLIWTDPITPNATVYLKVFDETNFTTVYGPVETMLSPEGAMNMSFSTNGFNDTHIYAFTASMQYGDGLIESTRYLEPTAPVEWWASCWASPYMIIPGDLMNLSIHISPAAAAVANISIMGPYGFPVWSADDIAIPESGMITFQFLTDNLTEGTYDIYANITRDGDLRTCHSSFYVTYLILDVENYYYVFNDTVFVNMRTLPTVSQIDLKIYQGYEWEPTYTAFTGTVNTTDGVGTFEITTNSSWPIGYYVVKGYVTVDSEVYENFDTFELKAFLMNACVDEYRSIIGEDDYVNVTVTTGPLQANASLLIGVYEWVDWEYVKVWNTTTLLGPYGNACVPIPLAGLSEGYYDVEVAVTSGGYTEYYYTGFELIERSFNVFASVDPWENIGYSMPILTVTAVPAQVDANVTINVIYGLTYYSYSLTDSNLSSISVPLPFAAIPSGNYWIEVWIESPAGSNGTWTSVTYSAGFDTDIDGLSDINEEIIGSDLTCYDSDGDGYFDGLEAFEGSDPLNPQSTPVGAPVKAVASAAITNPDVVNETNPVVINATEEVSTELTITNISAPCTISIKNVTTIPEEMEPATYFKAVGKILQITTSTSVTLKGVIRVYYDPAELNATGVAPESLKIYRWNTTSNEWDELPSFVNTTAHYVEANITHLSYWALMGRIPPTAVTLNMPSDDEITKSSVVLTWTANQDPDFDRYEIYRSNSPDELGTLVTTITDNSATTYTVTNLAPGTTYYFTVRVVNTAGLYTDSNTITVTTEEAPPFYTETWFMAVVAVVVIVIIVAVVLAKRK